MGILVTQRMGCRAVMKKNKATSGERRGCPAKCIPVSRVLRALAKERKTDSDREECRFPQNIHC